MARFRAATVIEPAGEVWLASAASHHLGEAGHVVGQAVQLGAERPDLGEDLLVVGSRSLARRSSQLVTSPTFGGGQGTGRGADPSAHGLEVAVEGAQAAAVAERGESRRAAARRRGSLLPSGATGRGW